MCTADDKWQWVCRWSRTKMVMVSRVYSTFDECYSDYVDQMTAAADSGFDLWQTDYRGVFTSAQVAALMENQ